MRTLLSTLLALTLATGASAQFTEDQLPLPDSELELQDPVLRFGEIAAAAAAAERAAQVAREAHSETCNSHAEAEATYLAAAGTEDAAAAGDALAAARAACATINDAVDQAGILLTAAKDAMGEILQPHQERLSALSEGLIDAKKRIAELESQIEAMAGLDQEVSALRTWIALMDTALRAVCDQRLSTAVNQNCAPLMEAATSTDFLEIPLN